LLLHVLLTLMLLSDCLLLLLFKTLLLLLLLLLLSSRHCNWVTSEAYSSPSIVLMSGWGPHR